MSPRKAFIAMAAVMALSTTQIPSQAAAESPAELNDLQIAHVAYTADNIDIRYAHLALAISSNPKIHAFARTMIQDHTAVNDQALALLAKLKAQPQDNFLRKSLNQGAEKLIDEMSQLRGAAFDRRYAGNELGYHKAVNDLVENSFIPNIEHPEVKALFKAGLKIFKVHEKHASMMVKGLK
jgi:putative membrane protein